MAKDDSKAKKKNVVPVLLPAEDAEVKELQEALDVLRQPLSPHRKKPVAPLDRFNRTTATWLSLLTTTDSDRSHTIELADDLPLFFYGRQQPGPEIKAIEREFVNRKKHYKIAILPAMLKEPGDSGDPGQKANWRRRYPGEREELVLEVVKYLASQKPVILDGDLGVPFTLAEIQRILADARHTMRRDQIKEGLQVLSRCKFIVTDISGKNVIEESPIKSLILNERGSRDMGVLQLNSFHTLAVKNGEYRGLNFPVTLGYQSVLARRIHKHIGHYFNNADERTPYRCTASELMRLVAFSLEDKPSKWAKRVEEALKENRESGYVKEYTYEPMKEGGRIKDYLFSVSLSQKFIAEIIAANAVQKRTRFRLDMEPVE